MINGAKVNFILHPLLLFLMYTLCTHNGSLVRINSKQQVLQVMVACTLFTLLPVWCDSVTFRYSGFSRFILS